MTCLIQTFVRIEISSPLFELENIYHRTSLFSAWIYGLYASCLGHKCKQKKLSLKHTVQTSKLFCKSFVLQYFIISHLFHCLIGYR